MTADGPHGYTVVAATPQELADWCTKNPNRPRPSTRRLRCDSCGRRIWGSGLGVGSHNRSKTCAATPRAQAAITNAIPRTDLTQHVIAVERFQLYPAGGGNYRSAWRWSYNYHVSGGPLCQYGPGLKSLRSMLKERFPGARIVETWASK